MFKKFILAIILSSLILSESATTNLNEEGERLIELFENTTKDLKLIAFDKNISEKDLNYKILKAYLAMLILIHSDHYYAPNLSGLLEDFLIEALIYRLDITKNIENN